MLQVDFRTAPLFADLSPPQLERLNRLAHHRTYHAGELVFREGEPGIAIFVITSGTFVLRHDFGTGDGPIEAILHAGQVMGLTSMLDEEPRRVSAYAVSDGTCAVLTRITFRTAMAENPRLALKVIRSMAQRLRAVTGLVNRY